MNSKYETLQFKLSKYALNLKAETSNLSATNELNKAVSHQNYFSVDDPLRES